MSRLQPVAALAIVALAAAAPVLDPGAQAQDAASATEYIGVNRVLSMRIPRAPNPFGVAYRVTALDTRGDLRFDKVMFHADDFGQFLVVGARHSTPSSVEAMDRDDPQTVLSNVSEAVLFSWRADLRDLPKVVHSSTLETEFGEALVRVYRVKRGSVLRTARGRRPTAADAFDTNIASIVARKGPILVFVLAQNDADPDDSSAVVEMAQEVIRSLRVLPAQ